MSKRIRIQTPRDESMVYEDDSEYELNPSDDDDDWENDSGGEDDNFISTEEADEIQTMEDNGKVFDYGHYSTLPLNDWLTNHKFKLGEHHQSKSTTSTFSRACGPLIWTNSEQWNPYNVSNKFLHSSLANSSTTCWRRPMIIVLPKTTDLTIDVTHFKQQNKI